MRSEVTLPMPEYPLESSSNHDHQEVNAMPTPFPYLLTEQSLTFYVDGQPHQVLRSHAMWSHIIEAVEAGDPEAVNLAKPIVRVIEALADLTPATESEKWFRRSAGTIEVTDWGVTYDGVAIHGHVIDRLLDVVRSGLNPTPWANFVRKLMMNPSSTSRTELYGWLEKSGMPITPDGDFIAYKRIRSDYRDIHSGTLDNSVGQTVEMMRTDVDDDRNRTCSSGLHFCSKDYLPHFGRNGSDDRVVVVKINPADVVSIPADYNDAKGRTWRYVVVGEMTLEEAGVKDWEPITYDFDEFEDDEWDRFYADDDADDDDEDTPLISW
jgi:hypothetical protein